MKKIELIKLADYLNIVNILIEKYSFSSLFKIEITALIIYAQSSTGMEVRKVTYNHINKFLLNFHSILLSNYSDFIFISRALKINESNGNISIEGDSVIKNKSLEIVDSDSKKYLFKENVIEILNEINSMAVKSFVQEVVANV